MPGKWRNWQPGLTLWMPCKGYFAVGWGGKALPIGIIGPIGSSRITKLSDTTSTPNSLQGSRVHPRGPGLAGT